MPIDITQVKPAIVNYVLTNYSTTPVTLKNTGGFDVTRQFSNDTNLHDLDVPFIEIDIKNSAVSKKAGVGVSAPYKSLGFANVHLYTCTGKGESELDELQKQLFKLLRGGAIPSIWFREADAGDTYTFRGKLCRELTFSFEYFESN